ncbi:DNA-directed RNA polymerase subunit omega [Lactobacillus sp. ESL0701]|uniref:DNA-directed RNA polymerase subunit omega n=1 Tax=unclassified Lactobacillus TaxID=2620435 RepID=UPI0023F6EBBB|nr:MULTISPECIES: DNA-directed RNA polymerase subunit omega [unclassified Lactobacillus]MDF7668153.1 DNA-directed RNA polymerase subunit omega [Lactobacillus sp. ESL0703]MDF7672420.1 DNA-directed RNA polymerase subunit omega [Lactobacillus sp. ESL0701]WEV38121.1 DNA-directed RNA polymerase subunit omega [Lactobacillus sp. ESL0680]
MRVTYPSIDKLLARVDSRYSLSVLAAKRAHELEAGDPEALKSYKSQKAVGKALEEIEAGKVTVDPEHREVNQ